MESTMPPLDNPLKQIINLVVGFENFVKQQFHLLNTNPESVNPFSLDKTIKEFLKHIEGATDKWLRRLDTSPTTRGIRDVWVKSEAGQKEFIGFLDETLYELEKMDVAELERTIPEHAHLQHLVHEYEDHHANASQEQVKWRAKWQAYWTQQQRYQRLVAQGITDVDKKYPSLNSYVKGDTLPMARIVAEETVRDLKTPVKKRRTVQQRSQTILERMSSQYYGQALMGLSGKESEEFTKFVKSVHEYAATNEAALAEQAKKVEFTAEETKQFAEEAHHYVWNKASADQLLREAANELPLGKERVQMALLQREIAKEDTRFSNANIKKLDQLLGSVPSKQRPLIDEIRFQRTTLNEFFNKHGGGARFMINVLEKDLALGEITMDEWRLWKEAGIIPKSARSRILRYFANRVDPTTLSRYGKILDEYQDLKRLFSGRLGMVFEKLGFKLPSNQLLRLAEQIQGISPTQAKFIFKMFGPKGLKYYSAYQRYVNYKAAWQSMSTATKLTRIGRLFETLATRFPRFASLFNRLSLGFGRVGNFFAGIEKAQAALGQALAKIGQLISSFLRSILPAIGRAVAAVARAIAQLIGKLVSWLLQLLMRFIAWVAQVAIPAIAAAIATLPGWALVALVILVVVVIVYFVVGIPGMFSAQDRRRRELAAGFIPGGESATIPGGGPVAPPAPPGQYIPPGGCMPAQSGELCCVPNEGFCSLAYTQPVFGDQARNASQVCLRESIGGYTAAINDGCLVGRSAEYSVGLFQINLLVHTPAGIYDPSLPEEMRLNPGETCHQVSSTPTGKQAFALWGGSISDHTCSIDNVAIFEHCRNYLLDPVHNLEMAKVIYEGRGDNVDGNLCGWMAWTTARNVVTLPDGSSRQFCGIVKPICEQ